jgi:hypothetical protein
MPAVVSAESKQEVTSEGILRIGGTLRGNKPIADVGPQGHGIYHRVVQAKFP